METESVVAVMICPLLLSLMSPVFYFPAPFYA